MICDNNGNPVTPAQAKKIIAERWTVPEDVRKRRRSRKLAEGPSGGLNRAAPARRPSPPTIVAGITPHPAHGSRRAGMPACPHTATKRITNMPEPAIALDHGQGEDLRELIEHAETIAQWLHAADDILDDLAQTAYPAHFQPRSAVWLIENLAHTRYRLTKPSSRRA